MYQKYSALIASALVMKDVMAIEVPVTKRNIVAANMPPHVSGIDRQSLVGTTSDQGFWFANFSIGASPSLSILLDTGSTDAIMNPGVYQPGPNSKDLKKTFTISYSTTNPDGSGSLTARGPRYQDTISLAGANANASSVIATDIGSVTSPKSPPTFPHDGLIGFGDPRNSALGAKPWWQGLCASKKISACRFGMAFKTDNTGSLFLGEAPPSSLIKSDIVKAQTSGQWEISGDVMSSGKLIRSKARIITDSGTTVVFGPTKDVQAMFAAANMTTDSVKGVLNGYYDCANPPQLGLAFGGQVFNIEPAALAQKKDGNKCTAVLHGTNQFGAWLVGQAWMQGKYVDHNIDDQTMGFAQLK